MEFVAVKSFFLFFLGFYMMMIRLIMVLAADRETVEPREREP